MKTFKNVNEYIAKADKVHQSKLRNIRKLITGTIPDAKEEIAYGMPGYKWNNKPLFYFAAMKGHLGLYPTPGPIETCKDMLKDFSTSKGCVRIPYSSTIPKTILVALLKARMKEIKEEA